MKKLLSKIICFLCIVSATMCFVSCFDDDSTPYPSLKTDLVVAETNAAGVVSKIKLDNGEMYDVTSKEVKFGVADTLFRCLASYAMENKGIKIYGITNIFSSKPVPLATLLEDGTYTEETLPRDPVEIISMWKSGGYINMQLGVLTTGNASHAYAFCEEEKGKYSLLHRRPLNVAESYTSVVFLSMPIPDGVESLTFSVNTYEGTSMRTF